MAGRYGDIDYPRVTKQRTLTSAALFAVGVLAEVVDSGLFGSLPAWEQTLCFDAETLGAVLLCVPFVFESALSLTE